MKIFTYFLIYMMLVSSAFAGMTLTNKTADNEQSQVEKTADAVSKATATTDIGKINARLVVEGATFRPFNLYLAQSVAKGSLSLAQDIHQIIVRDLTIIRGFNFVTHVSKELNPEKENALLKEKGAEGVSRIEIAPGPGSTITASIRHKNLLTGTTSVKSFMVPRAEQRKMAHLLAHNIYETFIGPEDIFLLQFAAVKRDGKKSEIVLLDFDGKNETPITSSGWPKTSLSFSLDGKKIFYTIIFPQGHAILEQDLTTKQQRILLRKPGVNLDARMLPDNSGMLATLSFDNSYNIHRITPRGEIVGKVTNSLGMNLSPSIRFDGKEFAFVSDRSGTPQIYVQPIAQDAVATRLTFQGKNNTTPQFSPDGKYIAFTGRDERKIFDIFLLERATGRVSRITENQGRNQDPQFTPSGRFVIFTSERENKSKPDIFIAPLTGEQQARLTDAQSDIKTLGYFAPVVRPKQTSSIFELRQPSQPVRTREGARHK